MDFIPYVYMLKIVIFQITVVEKGIQKVCLQNEFLLRNLEIHQRLSFHYFHNLYSNKTYAITYPFVVGFCGLSEGNHMNNLILYGDIFL